MHTLLDLLKQEQQCLIHADADGLEAITPQKTQYVLQMSDLAKQRHRALAGAGLPASDAAMATLFSQTPDPDAEAQWAALLALTREAKELNRVNGMLIGKQLSQTQQILAAMRPTNSPVPDPGLYGPGGQSSGFGASRRFVVG
ncbi:flagellar protein FlgN [Massilia sp. TS11]|nr:flagellar protein FlgN [Massilia sp. TS11]